MKCARFAILVISALTLASCMASLYPLYLPENLTSLKGIEGKWESDSTEIGDETWEFSKHDSLSYDLIYTEFGSPAPFSVHFVKLDSYLFIDLSPKPAESDNETYSGMLVPTHIFGRVWFQGDSLVIGWLDPEWLSDKLEAGDVSLNHEERENDQLLTAPTQELQAFAVRYANDPDAFPRETLTRAVQ
ncbi:MAG: hypothetical protein WAU88_15025 [Candidatus Zixiibacteriota bacterium]